MIASICVHVMKNGQTCIETAEPLTNSSDATGVVLLRASDVVAFKNVQSFYMRVCTGSAMSTLGRQF